jgi:hypothetical protein
VDDVSHLEKYRADLSFEGQGLVLEETESERSDPETVEQLDVDAFLSDDQ